MAYILEQARLREIIKKRNYWAFQRTKPLNSLNIPKCSFWTCGHSFIQIQYNPNLKTTYIISIMIHLIIFNSFLKSTKRKASNHSIQSVSPWNPCICNRNNSPFIITSLYHRPYVLIQRNKNLLNYVTVAQIRILQLI